MARTYYGKGWKPLRIVINRAFKKWPANACMHLLHEMAHVSVVISGDIGKPHGKTWRAVMMRLARAGAMKHIW